MPIPLKGCWTQHLNKSLKEVIREVNLFFIYANLGVKPLLNRCEPMIKKSGLDWTIVRCTAVMERPATGQVNAMP